MHRKTIYLWTISEKIVLITIWFEKIRVRLRVRLQGPCTRLQKSVHVAALICCEQINVTKQTYTSVK